MLSKSTFEYKDMEIIADLNPESDSFYVETVPVNILPTNFFLDKTILNRKNTTILQIELTVPFEASRNFRKADERTRDRYAQLRSDLESKGWATSFYHLGVGSIGMIPRRVVQDFSKIVTRCGGAKMVNILRIRPWLILL